MLRRGHTAGPDARIVTTLGRPGAMRGELARMETHEPKGHPRLYLGGLFAWNRLLRLHCPSRELSLPAMTRGCGTVVGRAPYCERCSCTASQRSLILLNTIVSRSLSVSCPSWVVTTVVTSWVNTAPSAQRIRTAPLSERQLRM